MISGTLLRLSSRTPPATLATSRVFGGSVNVASRRLANCGRGIGCDDGPDPRPECPP